MKTIEAMKAIKRRFKRYLALTTFKMVITIVAAAQTPTFDASPADGATISPSILPVFAWVNNGSSTYRLRVVPMMERETPLNAIERNAPVIDLVVAGAIYQYSPFNPTLSLAGRSRYAWSVTPVDRDGREDTAGRITRWFVIAESMAPPPATGERPAPSLVDCHCGPLRFMLPPRICAALGGLPTPVTDSGDIVRERPRLPAIAWIDKPSTMPTSGTTLRFRIGGIDGPAEVTATISGSINDLKQRLPILMQEDGTGSALLENAPLKGLWLFEITATAIDGRSIRDRVTLAADAYDAPETSSPLPAPTHTRESGSFLAYVTAGDIDEAERRARQAGAQADEARQKRQKQVEDRNGAVEGSDQAAARAAELVRIDNVLDRIPNAFRAEIDSLLRRLDSLRNSLGGTIDTAALDSAVAAAKRRRDDCAKTRQELEKEKKDLEGERDRLKKEQDDLLKEMDALHPASEGWSGRSGYYSDGTVHWGYIRESDGTSGWDGDQIGRYYDLRKKITSRNKDYKNKLKRLKELEQELADAARDCDEREKDVQAAEAARQRGDQASTVQNELNELCRQIRALLGRLRAWCEKHPSLCGWNDQLENLLRDCPGDSPSWEEFWNGLASVLEQKQARERQQQDERDSLDREVARLDSAINETDKEIDEHEEEEDQEWRRARRLQDQKAREEMERRRMEEDARRRGREEAMQAQRDCQDGFARWIAANQQHVDQGDLDALQKIVEGAQIAAESAGGYTGSMAKGASTGVSGMNAVASGLFSLGTSLFYAWMENNLKGAVKRIADNHALKTLAASLIGDRRACGVIQGVGLDGKPSTTSFYFFRKGNQVLVFRISATFGFECLGVTDA